MFAQSKPLGRHIQKRSTFLQRAAGAAQTRAKFNSKNKNQNLLHTPKQKFDFRPAPQKMKTK
jgi:hypothetical protein